MFQSIWDHARSAGVVWESLCGTEFDDDDCFSPVVGIALEDGATVISEPWRAMLNVAGTFVNLGFDDDGAFSELDDLPEISDVAVAGERTGAALEPEPTGRTEVGSAGVGSTGFVWAVEDAGTTVPGAHERR